MSHVIVCVSQVKKYEKRLFLPLALSDGKIVTDVQSKNMTMQLIKADAAHIIRS